MLISRIERLVHPRSKIRSVLSFRKRWVYIYFIVEVTRRRNSIPRDADFRGRVVLEKGHWRRGWSKGEVEVIYGTRVKTPRAPDQNHLRINTTCVCSRWIPFMQINIPGPPLHRRGFESLPLLPSSPSHPRHTCSPPFHETGYTYPV
jgi:hypothetical protein